MKRLGLKVGGLGSIVRESGTPLSSALTRGIARTIQMISNLSLDSTYRIPNMAVNRSRDMRAELELGIVENTYIRLYPNRGGAYETHDDERMTWPQYSQAEQHNVMPVVVTGCGCDHG